MEIIKKLSGLFRRRKEVEVAYLFGSHSRGEAGALSDIDVAVLFSREFSGKERFRMQLGLISEISGALGTDKVDVVVLNDAPLLLKYNAIKDGIVLASSEKKRVDFEVRTMQEYLDMSYYFDIHAQKAISRISGEGLA